MDLPVPDYGPNLKKHAAADRRRFWRAVLASLAFVAVLWWIKMIEIWLGADFASIAIRPRTALGLVGVITAPLLHGSVDHLLSNTLPLLILGSLAGWIYPRTALRTIVLVWLGSGLFVWLFGRPSMHLGASGVNHGLFAFLFVMGIIRRDRPAVAGAMIAFFLYGGMLMTVLPREIGVSWEAHLGGAIFGLLAGILWHRRDPAPPRKKYSWELEEEAELAMQEELARQRRGMFEAAPPDDVTPLWDGPGTARERREERLRQRGVVLRFPVRDTEDDDSDNEPPQRPTIH